MDFVSLHSHTTFSYKDGYGTPEDHAAKVADLGMGALALTEHGNVSSHVRHEKACREAGVKPIFGIEAYAGGVNTDDRTQRKNHIGILAKDDEGYKNLLRLTSRGWSEGFFYEPTVSMEMIDDHRSGLVVLSGCTASLLATSLVGGKNVSPEEASYERARTVASAYKEMLGDNYFLEVQVFHELPSVCAINQAYERLSCELDIPLVATADVHFCEPEHAEIRKILHAVRAGGKFVTKIEQEFDYTIPAEYPHSDAWVWERLVKSGLTEAGANEALENTKRIAEMCNVSLPKIENLRFPLPPQVNDPDWLMRQWIKEGWNYRGFHKLPDREKERYKERLRYEVDLVQQKGFTDYFLVVSDVIKFAKRSGIPVGPARGSAAASLTCYLLEITEVNPMRFPNLLFERFIDINRHDLPDIDIDFDDDRRHEIRDYLVEKYGADRVGNIGTFVQYKGKNSIDDVARVYGIPKGEVERLKNLLIERSSGDLRASATIEDTVEMFEEAEEILQRNPKLWEATKLEGNYRSMSVHAAGLVVSNSPLTDFCAVYQRENSKGEVQEVVSLDKYDAEYLNVLKLDALGLKTMGMIRIALEYIGMSLEELYAVPLDDSATLEGFREGDVVGVFQFDGRAMRSVNDSVCPDNFDEVCDINALARPGPLHGGATAEYIDVKQGRKQPRSYGPIVDEITSHTFGQVVYQEQILKVVREVGNFTWEEAARIRKIISKKRGEQEFNRQKGKFVVEAQKNGLEEKDASDLWSMLVTAGAYAFNAAHCVSYGMLAWWTMWLKRNHPLPFYVACLAKYGGVTSSGKAGGGYVKKDKTVDLLKDAAKKGIEILPPDPIHSQESWSIHDGKLLAGLTQIKGVGDKTAENMIKFRNEMIGMYNLSDRYDLQEIRDEVGFDWHYYQRVKGIGPKKIETIQDFCESDDPFGVFKLTDALTKVRSWLEEEGHPKYGLPLPTHTSEDVPYDRGENVRVVWLGMIQNRNLKDLYENHFSRTGNKLDPDDVKDPHLAEWVTMMGEDEAGPLSLSINRWKYPQVRDEVWKIKLGDHVVLLEGTKLGFQARKAVYIDKFWVLEV